MLPKGTLRLALGLFLCAVVVGLLVVAYMFLEPYWLTVREVTIHNPDVPLAFNGLRIAFLSDIHHGPYFSLARVRNAVDRTNQLHPDIILLGGDYVHRDACYIAPCFAELARLQAKLGTFGVLGNHDPWEDAALTRESMQRAGIHLLDNRAEWVMLDGQRIKLGGVGDLWEDEQDLAPTLAGVTEGDMVVLLSHHPDYAETLTTDLVDLVLSGHNHGGQVTLFGLWAPLLPSSNGQKYRTGTVHTGLTTVVISNGVGTVTPPLRFCARPEIILVRLER